MGKESFNDYYEALQLSPNADSETIERVFWMLAKRYHPDNDQTGNAYLLRPEISETTLFLRGFR